MQTTEQNFTDMVRENRSTIFTVCYMFSKDQQEVNDLFQEILINLWRGYSSFQGRSEVRTWIYRVSLNTCISIDRKKKRKKTVPLTMDINPFDDHTKDTNQRQVNQLRKRIARLGPIDRAIILLWLEDLSYDEIGSIVGISARNVGVKLFRIKEELKKMNE